MMKQKKITTHDICTLGVLIAITVVLSAFFTFRIGSAIKIPLKFLSVCLTSVLFGPVAGGLTAVISDILAYFVNSGGAAFMPQITFVEFLYGVSYGLFLKNINTSPLKYLRGILCVLFQIIVLNLIVTSYFLIPVMNLPYTKMILLRLPAAGINLIIQLIGISVIISASDTIKTLSGRYKK